MHPAPQIEHDYEPHVSGVLLRMLADVAKQHGVSPSALLPGTATHLLQHEPVNVRMPLAEFRALAARAIDLTGEPALGLHCGLRASESAFDLLAPLVAHVPSLRHAIDAVRRYQALAFEGLRIRLTETSGVARLVCEIPRAHDDTDRFLSELAMSGLMRLLQAFGCTSRDLLSARFDYSRPPYPWTYATYTTTFERRERFDEAFTGLEFASRVLDQPHLHANPTLHALVQAQCERRLASLSLPTGPLDRLKLYLASQRPSDVPDIEGAARALGMSSRTLRRRLAEEGVSYRDLTQAMQRDRACTMLRDPERTLQSIAHALGFTEAASFHRAFKRWTGQTASDYRAAWGVGS